MIKAVLFDIDGVLLDSFEANLKFFQDLMVSVGYPAPTREVYTTMFHLSMMDVIRVLTQSDDEEEIMRIWEIGRAGPVPYDLNLLKMPEGAAEVIKELSRNYALALVTSRIRESVFESPLLGKLKNYFQAVAAYQDTVEHKPHPAPLLFAAKTLGVDPVECVYIGDVENDVKAARAAGMRVILYSDNDVSTLPDARVSSLREVPKVITTLSVR